MIGILIHTELVEYSKMELKINYNIFELYSNSELVLRYEGKNKAVLYLIKEKLIGNEFNSVDEAESFILTVFSKYEENITANGKAEIEIYSGRLII